MAAIAPQFVLDHSYLEFTDSGKISGWNAKAIQQLGHKLKQHSLIDLKKIEINADRISELLALLSQCTKASIISLDISQLAKKYSFAYFFQNVERPQHTILSGADAHFGSSMILKVNFCIARPPSGVFTPQLSTPSPSLATTPKPVTPKPNTPALATTPKPNTPAPIIKTPKSSEVEKNG